ncbi:hypothetical protein DL96DRAFT_1715587 [Flagelloscypha sp. PMI_526]|nr:hypothetical protein DL96DRAFT_1715587 [Flagelloscypha sp. PMI_526]
MSSLTKLPAMDSTIGAMEVGIFMNVFLFGVTTTQTYNYFVRFPDDHKFLRWSVLVVWISEVSQTVGLLHSLYIATVTFFGNPITLLQPPKSLILTIVLGGVCSALSTLFPQLCEVKLEVTGRQFRSSLLGGGLLSLALLCCFLTLVFLVGCFGFTITGYHATSLPEYMDEKEWLFTALLIVRMTNDIIMTVGLCLALIKSRKRAQQKTTAVIDKLILWVLGSSDICMSSKHFTNTVVETGVLTAICAMITVIFFFQSRDTFIWVGVYVLSPKLFSNSFLAVSSLFLSFGKPSPYEYRVTSTLRMTEPVITTRSGTMPGHVDINVVKVQHSDLDYHVSIRPSFVFQSAYTTIFRRWDVVLRRPSDFMCLPYLSQSWLRRPTTFVTLEIREFKL